MTNNFKLFVQMAGTSNYRFHSEYAFYDDAMTAYELLSETHGNGIVDVQLYDNDSLIG